MAFKWNLIANIMGPQGPIGTPGEFSVKTVPAGDISTWYGLSNVGYYRAASQGVVDAIPGRPAGAGPGNIYVWPIGSTTSLIRWVEFGDMGREWSATVSSTALYKAAWTLTQKTKRVATTLTCGRANDQQTQIDVGHALPMTFAARVHRWRVHIRNTNDRTANTMTGSLTLTVGFGEMVRNADGTPSPNIVAGTYTQIVGAAVTSSAGNEYVSPWCEKPLAANKDYVLRYGFTGAAGQQVNYLEGGGWTLANLAAMDDDTPASPALTNRSPLDVWVELEVDPSTPNYAYFGDSLTVGQGATLPVYDSWPAKHARARGAIPTFYAHSGARMSEFTSASNIKLNKYNLAAYNGTISKPTVLYWAMGSNDLFAEFKTVTQMLDAMAITYPLITDVTSRNVVMCTVLPRLDAGDAMEVIRREWNEYITMNLPRGTLAVYDAAAALTVPAGDTLNLKWQTAPGDIHLNSAGYAKFATQVAT